jgi:hypothetical protein
MKLTNPRAGITVMNRSARKKARAVWTKPQEMR